MSIFRDNLNTDTGWEKTGAYVNGTKAVANGVLTITKGTNYKLSTWMKTGMDSWNTAITFTTSGGSAGKPQAHLRETDQNNFIIGYLEPASGQLKLATVTGGTFSVKASSAAIPDFSNATDYDISFGVMGNKVWGYVLPDGEKEGIYVEYIHNDISAFTATRNGIGVSVTAQGYDSVDMRTLTDPINVVCVGDSNVDGASEWAYWPDIIARRRMGTEITCVNEGASGWATQDIIADYANRVSDHYVTGVRNLLIIATGNNDIHVYGLTAEEAYAQQIILINMAKATGFDCQLNTMMQIFNIEAYLTFVNTINPLITNGAVANNYISADIYTFLGSNASNTTVVPADARGGVHYTESGHELVATEQLRTFDHFGRQSVT